MYVRQYSFSVIMAAFVMGLGFTLVACATSEPVDTLTVDDAVKNASELHGLRVSVVGYLVLEFEDHNLYASREDAREKVDIDERCIALSLTEDVFSKWEAQTGSRVRITGVLNKGYCGDDEFCPYACNKVGIERIKIDLPH